MFNIGGGELLVIALIALIVLGPQRLPGAARQAGKAMGELRRLSTGFQTELRSAFDEAERSGVAAPVPASAPPAPADLAAVEAVSSQATPSAPPTATAGPAKKKTAAKQTTAQKAATKKTTAKKTAVKKTAAKRVAAKKAATKTTTAKKTATKTTTAKKVAPKQATASRPTRRGRTS